MRRIELQDAEQKQPAPEPSPPAEKKDDLKKQSQFVPGENDAKSFVKGDYDKMSANSDDENKANLSQFPAPERIIGVEKGDKPVAVATG